jgi:hypothetical protein
MMTSWPTGLVALACVAMVTLMCLPMAVGVIRRRARRSRGDTAAHPAGQPPAPAPDLTRGEQR